MTATVPTTCGRHAAPSPSKAAIALTIVLITLSSLTGVAGAQDTVSRLFEALQIRRPEGAGPFPAIMLVPICSGMSKKEHVAHYREMAERFQAMGYLVVHVDYVAAHQLTSACGSFVTPHDIAKDIFAVVKHLHSLSFVNPARIDAIGESLGGGGVLEALSQPGPDDLPAFRRAVVFYPVCRGLSPPRARAQVLMLFGALDGMTPAESCRQLVHQFSTPTDVQLRVYPDAYHGFNLAHLPQAASPGQPSRTPAFHPAAMRAAWEDTVNFLRR